MSRRGCKTVPHEDADPPRPLDVVRADLEQLRGVKTSFSRLPNRDFAAEVSMISIETRESELLAEESFALLLEGENDVEMVLDGGAVRDGAIEAGFLADVLGRFQGLTNAVAEARAGESRRRGVVKEDIREPVQLMVQAFATGSFGVRLTVPPQPDQLFGHGVLGSAISLFDPDPEHGEFLTLMRLDRVRSNYGDLMRSLVRHKSSIAIASRELTHRFAFTPTMAKERLDWMELIDVSEQPLKVTGVLAGGDVARRTYHLETEDEEFTGKVLDTAIGELKQVKLGSEVQACLTVVTKAQADGIVPSRIQYYLESIEPLTSGAQSHLDE